MLAVSALRAQCPDGTPPPCATGVRPITLSSNLVAVAPFDVLAPELQLWREGLVDVVSQRLDGAGPVRTVSPSTVIRRWRGRADPSSASNIGHATGAGLVVFGRLIGRSGDSVRLSASLFDTEQSRVVAEFEWSDRADNTDRLGDSLTVALLRELGRTRAIGAFRETGLGTTSLPALKAFLRGEQFLRRSNYDSALAYYQRAITLDTTFTLAFSHASMAVGWQHTAGDSLALEYGLIAGRLNHGLAPRESLLVQSDSLSAVVTGGPVQLAGRWWTLMRRLLSTLDEAVRRYPEDPALWYSLGDARFHFGVYFGEARERSLEAFDRAIALDSAFSPAYIHTIGMALEFRGPVAARRYAEAFLRVSPAGKYASFFRLVALLLDPRADPARTQRLMVSLAPDLSFLLGGVFDRWPDSAETQVRLARVFMEHSLPGATTAADSLNAVQLLAYALAYRGHLREAYRLIGASTFVYLELALLGAVPGDSADAVFRTWIQQDISQPYAWKTLPWWAARRDTATLSGLHLKLEEVAAQLPSGVPPIAKEAISYLIQSTQAYLTLARGDSAAALLKFLALPDTACFGGCPLDGLTRTQLLEAQGRPAEALEWLDRLGSSFLPPLPSDALQRLARGRLNDRLGNRERAIEAYRYVLALWAHADPELQSYVDEARGGLERLRGTEPRP